MSYLQVMIVSLVLAAAGLGWALFCDYAQGKEHQMKKKAAGVLAAMAVVAGVGMVSTPSNPAPPAVESSVEAWAPQPGTPGSKKNPCSPGFRYDPVTISCVWSKSR